MPRCPMCPNPVEPDARSFPFCSERCRLLDLGNWLDERYLVPGEEVTDVPTAEDDEPSTDRRDN